jgi:hypothetical protein
MSDDSAAPATRPARIRKPLQPAGLAAPPTGEQARQVLAGPTAEALNIGFAAVDRQACGPNADRVAIHWLGSNLRTSDQVAIAAEALQLGPAGNPTLAAPVDAGAWINPLTGIGAVLLPSDVDLGAQAVHDDLCRGGVRYIYVGGSSRGFDAKPAQELPTRFTTRLLLPGASVVEILGCGV